MRHTLTRYVVALGLSAVAWGLPQDPSTAHGQVQIQNLGPNFMQILQSSPQAILNWNQFNIGLGETVRFLQPSTQAAILNRVTGMDPSLIQGMLQANGRVFLLNPNGILFGPNSMVDVGSFTASTLKMSDDDFLSGNFRLTQDRSLPLAALTNQGQIHVAEGGFVVLVSPLLDNQGLIVAQSGHVNLGATTQATFSVDGRGQVQFAVPDGFNPQFTGGGQGGTVLLQPGQMSQMLSQVVNNPALVEAGSFQPGSGGQTLAHGAEGVLLNSGTIQADGGSIRLDSSQATVHGSDGLLRAAAGDVRLLSDGATVSLGRVQGDGAFAEISGHHLWLYGSVDVGTAGTILLDPDNIQIVDGANGTGSYDAMLGSLPGTGDGSVSTGAIVAATNLVLNANNDISYTGNGFFGPSTNLSLIAGNDITITPTGTIELGSIVLSAGRHVTLQNGNDLNIWADNGPFTVQAGGNLNVSAGRNMDLRAIGSTLSLHADNDLTMSAGNGYTINESATLTNLSAGQDVNIQVQNWSQPGVASVVNIDATRDFNLTGHPVGTTSWGVAGLNVTAGRDISTTQDVTLAITATNDLKLAAGRNLTMNEGVTLALTAQNGVANLSGQQITLNAPGGDVRVQGQTAVSMVAGAGNLTAVAGQQNILLSPAGSLTMRAQGGSISDTAGTNLRLGGATATSVNASNNLSVGAGDGYTVTLEGTSQDLRAGGNLSLRANNFNFGGAGGPLNLTAGNDLNLTSFSGLAIGAQSLAVNATRDILINPPLSLSVTTTGNQTYTAGRNLSIINNGTQTLTSNNGQLVLQGGNVTTNSSSHQHHGALNGISIIATSAVGDVNMTMGSDIVLDAPNGPVNITSQRDIFLNSGADIGLKSGTGLQTTINATRDVVFDGGLGYTTYFRGSDAHVRAGRDLTLKSTQILNNSPDTALNFEAGQDMVLGNQSGSVLRVEGASVNATAGRDLQTNSVSSMSILGLTGDTRLQAGGNLNLNSGGNLDVAAAGQLTLQGQDVKTRSQGNTNLAGPNGLTVAATAGNVDMAAVGELNLRSTSGAVQLTASQDIGVDATSDMRFNGALPGTVSAGRDLAASTGTGRTLDLSGGAYLSGGRNVTLTNDRIASGDVSIQSGSGDVVIRPTANPGASNRVDVNSLNVTAGQDLLVLGDGSVDLTAQTGDLKLSAGRNLTVQANSGHSNASAAGQIRMGAGQDVTVQAGQGSVFSAGTGLNVTATAGDVNMQNPSALELKTASGIVRVQAGQDINLQPNGNLSLRTPNNLIVVGAGRDLTLTAPLGTSVTLDGPNAFLSGGRNVTFTGDQLSGDRLNIRTTTGNVTLQGLPGRNAKILAATTLNITSGRDLIANADGDVEFVNFGTEQLNLNAIGNVALQAGGHTDIVANGVILMNGANVTTRASTNSLIYGVNGVQVGAPNGDVDLQVSAGSLEIRSDTGGINLAANRDVNLQAGTTVNVTAPLETRMDVGRDITFTTGAGSALTLDGDQSLSATRDITFNTNTVGQNTPGALSMFAQNDINLPPARSGTFTVNVGSFHAAAAHNLNGTVNGGDLNINASTGGIYLRADNQLDLNTTGGGTHLNAANGNVSIESSQGIALGGTVLTVDAAGVNISTDSDSVFAAGSAATAQSQGIRAVSSSDLDLRNLRLTSNGGGNVDLHADGTLKVGPVATTALANATLSGGNIVIHSMDDISGGNYTVTTGGNLTDEVPAGNTPPVLTGLDITAAHIFNPNNAGDFYAFSIPRTASPDNLHVLVTGGNQTVGTMTSSASLRNRNSADVQPNHIQGQTGDIYVDGALFYQGEAVVPPPPPPPPSPPPVPPLPPLASEPGPVVTSGLLTAEQRSQILAQSNLALGNLGSFSRVLSESERERMTVRQDALNQTWALDPFSPTLALVVPGGRPLVYPSELAQLQALLLMSEDDPEEKIRGAYNTIVDQELREIWEVRYWRHLLENFVIWEDRE